MISAAIPPHRAIHLPGLHAYANAVSVVAGEEIAFHVSSTVPYTFSVVCLRSVIDDAVPDTHVSPTIACSASPQAIHPGSYLFVEKGLTQADVQDGLAIELWLKPWENDEPQAIVSQTSSRPAGGFELSLGSGRCLIWRCCDAAGRWHSVQGPVLDPHRWAHVVAQWDASGLSIWVDAVCAASGTGPEIVALSCSPLRVGANEIQGQSDQFLDADLATPAIYDRCLSSEEITRRHNARGVASPIGGALLAQWPLDEERGDTIQDHSGHERHGVVINHGTWMVPGPAFDPSSVPHYSRDEGAYVPERDVTRGHAFRMASDDLMDCRWPENHRVRLSPDAVPGLYAGRFECILEGDPIVYDVTFVVRHRQDTQRPPLLVLCATNTWRAYAASPFAANQSGAATWPRRAGPLPNSHPAAPNYNHYTPHRAGQPTYFSGLRVPCPNASPSALYAPEGAGFSHGPRLERHLHSWLNGEGYAFDVAADLDLHRDPSLLSRYQCVVINGHSEYWSSQAYDGLETYLNRGGNLIVLSGNTMYWRVSFDKAELVMEQRKTLTPPESDEQSPDKHAAPGGIHGEQYHSHDGQRGGLWRFNDRTCAEVIGLETAGWAFADAEDFGVYQVTDPEHFLFHTPHPTGLSLNDTFGHGPGGALPRAIGHEWDLTLETLARLTPNPPARASLPPAPTGVQVIAHGVRNVPGRMDAYLDFFERAIESDNGLSAEMIYWERPQGGHVFNAGAVGASWVLGADPAFGALLKNVLHHFGITR